MKKLAIGFLFVSILGIILVINYYPHYYALINTPKNSVYAGQASWFDPWDIANYFAVIRVAQKERTMLVGNINTTEIAKPTFIYPLYTLAGIIFPKADSIFIYHILAVIFGIGLAVILFFLAQMLVKNYWYSLYILLLTSLGGGFGFLVNSPEASADLSIPGVTLLSTFQKPHEAAAAVLYLTSLVFFFKALKDKRVRFLVISTISLLLLIPIYPYRLASFTLIAGIFCLVVSIGTGEKYPFKYLGALLTVITPVAVGYVYHFFSSGFSVLTSYRPSPIPVVALLLGYGAFGSLFVGQLYYPMKNKLLGTFLNIWVLVSLGIAILPLGISRLFLSGLLFPLAIISVNVISSLGKRFIIPILYFVCLIGFLSTSLGIFTKRITEVANKNIWYYLPSTLSEGINFLQERQEDGVLALPPLANYIPAFAGKHVYFGIQDQTPGYLDKVNQATIFYQGKLSVEEAKEFLEQNQIHLIVATNLSYPFLTEVFRNQDISIYQF